MLYPRFDALIIARGMSNADTARKLGVSDVLVGAWRKGKYDPSSENLKKISDLFDVSADYLLGETDDPSPQDNKNKPAASESDELTERGKALARKISCLPEQYQVVIEAAVDRFGLEDHRQDS